MTAASAEPVHLQTSDHDGVRLLTIDRPEAKNALNPPLRAALVDAFTAADADDAVKAIVLTAVDPVFSAGVDFKQVSRGPDGKSVASGPHDNPAAVLRRVRKPVIAAVNGASVSGALEIALSASFIVASAGLRGRGRLWGVQITIRDHGEGAALFQTLEPCVHPALPRGILRDQKCLRDDFEQRRRIGDAQRRI